MLCAHCASTPAPLWLRNASDGQGELLGSCLCAVPLGCLCLLGILSKSEVNEDKIFKPLDAP